MRIFFYMFLLIMTGFSNSYAEGSCDKNSEAELIEQTKMLILEKYEHTFPSAPRNHRYESGCVVISFDINSKGIAENMEVLAAEPDRFFIRSAKYALSKYVFEYQSFSLEKGVLRFDFKL